MAVARKSTRPSLHVSSEATVSYGESVATGGLAQASDGHLRRGGVSLVFAAIAVLGLTSCSKSFNIADLDRSVVRVQHQLTSNGKTFRGPHGTGFVLNAEGYVVTNHHVVDLTGKLPSNVKATLLYVPDGSWKKKLKANKKGYPEERRADSWEVSGQGGVWRR